jgi:hypothetical protein
MLLGWTTAKVLKEVECPVLTTEHAQTMMPRSLEHRQWVCPVGIGEDSQRVLRSANESAALVDAKLSVIEAKYDGNSNSILALLHAARKSATDVLIIGQFLDLALLAGRGRYLSLDSGFAVSSVECRMRDYRAVRTAGSTITKNSCKLTAASCDPLAAGFAPDSTGAV